MPAIKNCIYLHGRASKMVNLRQCLKPWVVIVVAVVVVVVLLWILSVPRRSGLQGVTANITLLDGQEVLVIDGLDHPPWALSHMVSATSDQNVVTIVEYYIRYSPFIDAGEIRRGWPIILDRRQLTQPEYSVRYWDGDRYVTLGRLYVEPSRMHFIAQN